MSAAKNSPAGPTPPSTLPRRKPICRKPAAKFFACVNKLTSSATSGSSTAPPNKTASRSKPNWNSCRRRAAELAELLAEQKDQMTQQQTIWSSELKILRQLLETQSHSLHVSRPAEPVLNHAAPATSSPAAAAPAAEGAAPENPVVDSIMEQFAKLQKDVAQRRKRKLQ